MYYEPSVEAVQEFILANFAGLRGRVNPIQRPQIGVQVTIAGATKGGGGFFLPFLGDVKHLNGKVGGGRVTFTLPTIEKSAVFWYEP